MFRAYAIDLNEISPLIKNEPAQSIYNKAKTENIKETLKKILSAETPFLDSAKLCQLFFPVQNCPVFLSHSGQNKEEVKQFAQWLKKYFEINAFVDSDLWGCIEDLQKSLDYDFCRIDPDTKKHIDKNTKQNGKRTTYSYSDRNTSTAHVHMMLCHALTQMIDSAECFIFLKSSDSYAIENGMDGTFSPWIFHELAQEDKEATLKKAADVEQKCSKNKRTFDKTIKEYLLKQNFFIDIAFLEIPVFSSTQNTEKKFISIALFKRNVIRAL